MKKIIFTLPILLALITACSNRPLINQRPFIPTYRKPDISKSNKQTIILKNVHPEGHDYLGKSGCIPKSKLVLNAGNFFDFSLLDGANTYYYIPYQTAYVHMPDGSITSYSPAYYRSGNSEFTILNKIVSDNNMGTEDFGIGICSLVNYNLSRDSQNRYYFEDEAIIYNGRVYPQDKNCLDTSLLSHPGHKNNGKSGCVPFSKFNLNKNGFTTFEINKDSIGIHFTEVTMHTSGAATDFPNGLFITTSNLLSIWNEILRNGCHDTINNFGIAICDEVLKERVISGVTYHTFNAAGLICGKDQLYPYPNVAADDCRSEMLKK